MIVVNKRYYDYDYDNNTIIMFDAEDVGLTLDLEVVNDIDIEYMIPTHSMENDVTSRRMEQCEEEQSELEESKSNKPIINKVSDPSNIQSQSQSTDTVPDIVPHPQPVPNHNSADNADEKTPGITPPSSNSNKTASNNRARGHISWISSTSPKGSRRIPYALHIAHSYTCSKLPVSLTQLVDVATIQKQQQQQQENKKKKAAAAAAAALYHQQHHHQQQQQQQQNAMYPQYVGHHQHQQQHPIPPHHGHPGHPHHGIHPSYGYPPPHHSRHTAYAHHHGHHQQRDPYLSPPSYHTPPHHAMTSHGHRHGNGQRKQEIPASSPRGYQQTATTQQQQQQYISYNTTATTK